jgi:hypothetical protein
MDKRENNLINLYYSLCEATYNIEEFINNSEEKSKVFINFHRIKNLSKIYNEIKKIQTELLDTYPISFDERELIGEENPEYDKESGLTEEEWEESDFGKGCELGLCYNCESLTNCLVELNGDYKVSDDGTEYVKARKGIIIKRKF